MIRVVLPGHLRTLAGVAESEVDIDVAGDATIEGILGALERRYPQLLNTIRDRTTGRRRPFVRYFACGRDLSHDDTAAPLPKPIIAGEEPFLIVGAMAGG
ncbi:MAG: MoaD/ThiS family protein [Vulcanimicrobiaceae bacterium]